MDQVKPPLWINRLMSVFVSKALWECIEGDLFEIYEAEVAEYGKRKADRRYFFHALGFLRFRRLRNKHYSLRRFISGKTQITMDLFNNYLKVSWRDLRRNKTFAIINLTGLIAGFTACLLILQYVFYETGFDRFHEDSEQLYRVVNDRYQNGELVQHGMITYPLVGKAMKEDLPEVTAYTRMTTGGRNYIRKEDQLYMIDDFLYADQHFLDVFSFSMKDGKPETALDEPYEIVITASFAERFLKAGEETGDLIGQSVRIFTSAPACKISGILEDVPDNSHLQFDVLISFETMNSMSGGASNESWDWSDFYHYVRLEPGADLQTVNAKLADFGVKYFKDGSVSGSVEKFYLQPLEEAHLYSDFEYEIGVVRNGRTVWLMLFTAIFLIIIAWVNFINLSTSRATERAKEIGVRKSLGASGIQLFWQFLAESVLVNGIALLISVGLVVLLLEPYKTLTGLPLSFSDFLATDANGFPYLLTIVMIFIVCLILISIYPATVMSRYQTRETLKGRYSGAGDAVMLRRGLVVFQFVAALILITGTFTLNRQIEYMQDRDLGMNMQDNLVLYGPAMSEFDSTFIGRFDEFRHELQKIPGIESVTASSRVFSQQTSRWFGIKNASDPQVKNLSSNVISTDHAFTSQFAIELQAGRRLQSSDHNYDGSKVDKILINETAVEHFKLGNPESAIGKKLEIYGRSWEIVGVTADFHQRSLHQKMEPMILTPFFSTENYIIARMSGEPDAVLTAKVVDAFNAFFPGNYVDYFYLEDYYNQKYANDRIVESIAQVFTFIAILIALLGLYGLVMITMSRRTKEVAVRKVLGASVRNILMLLGRDFLWLILIAILLGIPLSYYILGRWLENYAYSDGVNWWILLAAASGLILVSIGTVLIQTRKVAKNNPADSLKYE